MKAAPPARNIVLAPFFSALLLLFAAPLAAQERGALFGMVVDDRSDEPIAGAEVLLVGTRERSKVDSDGVFILTDLPLGPVQLRIERPGYSTAIEQVEITADSLAALEVRLLPIAVMLDELLVIARGSLRSGGSSVTEVRPTRESGFTAADLLANVPGLRMAADRGSPGRPAGLNMRGASSITQSTSPAIYVDGVRVADLLTPSQPNSLRSLSILSQIPAKEVVRILVLRGPSAEARYADSANGVILIETTRGDRP